MLLEMTTGTWIILGAVFFIALVCFILNAATSEQWEEAKKYFGPIVAILLVIGAIWAIIEMSS